MRAGWWCWKASPSACPLAAGSGRRCGNWSPRNDGREAGLEAAMKRLVIATRRSRLALWQAEHIKRTLQTANPGLEVALLPLSTRGDELQEVRLETVGGKGLFIKELEKAMAQGRADPAGAPLKD